MDEETVVIGAYPCPHCQRALEVVAGAGHWGWLRCPACGRPGLPPSVAFEQSSLSAAQEGDVVYILDTPEAPPRPRAWPRLAVLLVATAGAALAGMFAGGEPQQVALLSFLFAAALAALMFRKWLR